MRTPVPLACSLVAGAFLPALVTGQAPAAKEARKLPASAIVTSWGQSDGATPVGRALKEKDDGGEKALEQASAAARRRSATDVFMVEAEDFSGAVGQTRDAFCEGVLGNTGREPFAPFRVRKREANGAHWVFAFLGNGAQCTRGVAAVEVGKSHVRVSFDTLRVDTDDVHSHLLWARVGVLDPGKYTLELYDTKHKEVVLARTVHVTKK